MQKASDYKAAEILGRSLDPTEFIGSLVDFHGFSALRRRTEMGRQLERDGKSRSGFGEVWYGKHWIEVGVYPRLSTTTIDLVGLTEESLLY